MSALKCTHKGCGKVFTDPEEPCYYHPGAPIFHEGQKGQPPPAPPRTSTPPLTLRRLAMLQDPRTPRLHPPHPPPPLLTHPPRS